MSIQNRCRRDIMPQLFRCGSDVQFEPQQPTLGHVHDVHLKTFSETCNILQYLKPLTPQKPYFQLQVQSMGKYMTEQITISKEHMSNVIS